MLDKISSALKTGFDKIAGALFLDKKTIESVVKDLQRALIQADVNIQLVKKIGDKIKKEAENENIKGIDKKEHLTKILHDEILNLIGKEKHELKIEKGKVNKIMLLGLYGAGKTTTSGKLAQYYQKRGFKTALLGLDVHRPAAAEQLEQLGKKINIPVFINKTEKDPIKIYKHFKPELEKYDLTIIDTAGRHNLDQELTNELKLLTNTIIPNYKLLVIQADIGQAAKTQASEFQNNAGIDGVIITRMDSTAKAGGALTACNETNSPVYFIGTGEKMNELETFNPKSFISRLLGLGDLEGLLEQVQSAIDQKTQKEMQNKLASGNINLRDFQEQLKQMQNIGSMDKLLSMIPGMGKAKIPENMLGTQEDKMKKWQHIINSMTEEEINHPEILEKQTSRIGRIAKGSGSTTSEIRQLLKQFKLLKELTTGSSDLQNIDPSQGLSQKQMQKMAKKLKGKFKF